MSNLFLKIFIQINKYVKAVELDLITLDISTAIAENPEAPRVPANANDPYFHRLLYRVEAVSYTHLTLPTKA